MKLTLVSMLAAGLLSVMAFAAGPVSETSVASADGFIGRSSSPNGECSMAGLDAQGRVIYGGAAAVVSRTITDGVITLSCAGMAIQQSTSAQTTSQFRCKINLPNGRSVLATSAVATISPDGPDNDDRAKSNMVCSAPVPAGTIHEGDGV